MILYTRSPKDCIASQIASDVVYERDLQTGIATFYGDIDSHLGYEPGGYPRTTEGWREHVHPEDRARIESQPMDQIEPGVPYSVEYHMRKKDGTYMTWSDRIMLIQDEKTGKPLRFIGTATDITEQRQMEEELQKIDKLESVGTLAGGIAHDFNNILTGIMGNISLAKRNVEPKSKAEERLLEAEKASMRARDLTQQLLTFSRGGAPVKKLGSVKGVIEDSASFALRGSNVKCEFSLPEDLWSVEIDEGQISQVINNLVINADQVMPNGGTINIKAQNVVLKEGEIATLSKGIYILVTVKDQGIGIPPKHLDRIFDPYFTTKQKGSGLGLSTTYSIIRNHDGYITVESTPHVGTTFYIYLPAAKKKTSLKEHGEVAETLIRGKGRILVMDDEETIREFLYAELTEVGYEVQLTNDGVEAIEQYSEAKKTGKSFDAVILDLTVPGGMGGKEAIKKLLEIDPKVKAIVSSGYATDPIMAEYKKYGFKAMVTKPYSIEQLEKTLHGLFRK
ncbi:ATP-binding protein, partial [Chloroflexota bacterium]